MFHRPKSEERPVEKAPQKEPEQQKVEQQPAAEKAKSFVAPKPEKQPETVQTKPVENKTSNIQTTNTAVKEEKTMSIEKPEGRDIEDRSSDAPAGVPFQRPPQMQRSVPAGFSSPYSSSSQGIDGRTAEDRRLVIGQGITMSGEIEACDYLLVEGTLEAALKGAKVLEIAQSGTFYGAVEIEEATVAGRFEGDLTVNGRLTIKSGGSVTGAVAYKELAVEAGATLDGKISPLANVGVAQETTPKKNMAPKNDNSGQEEGGELPFSGGAIAAAE